MTWHIWQPWVGNSNIVRTKTLTKKHGGCFRGRWGGLLPIFFIAGSVPLKERVFRSATSHCLKVFWHWTLIHLGRGCLGPYCIKMPRNYSVTKLEKTTTSYLPCKLRSVCKQQSVAALVISNSTNLTLVGFISAMNTDLIHEYW